VFTRQADSQGEFDQREQLRSAVHEELHVGAARLFLRRTTGQRLQPHGARHTGTASVGEVLQTRLHLRLLQPSERVLNVEYRCKR